MTAYNMEPQNAIIPINISVSIARNNSISTQYLNDGRKIDRINFCFS